MSAQAQTSSPNLGMDVTTFENPMGIDGFEFVEFAAPQGQAHLLRLAQHQRVHLCLRIAQGDPQRFG